MPPLPKKKSAIVEESPWRERKIKVALENSLQRFATVIAKCLGEVAVFTGQVPLEGKEKWRVTSVTTGLLIALVNTEEDALRIGEQLWGSACLALREKTKEAINSKLPGWVKPWALACREAGAWLDPARFH